jgi:predicted O-methyltransferase YrrM
VLTLEYEPHHADVARANLERAGVADRVQVVVGAALETLPTLDGDPFDMVFIDADKENYVEYLRFAAKLARPGALVVVDNVIREGAILNPDSDDEKVVATRETLQVMGEHAQLETAVLQTVGAKHWDGFAIALVKHETE